MKNMWVLNHAMTSLQNEGFAPPDSSGGIEETAVKYSYNYMINDQDLSELQCSVPRDSH